MTGEGGDLKKLKVILVYNREAIRLTLRIGFEESQSRQCGAVEVLATRRRLQPSEMNCIS